MPDYVKILKDRFSQQPLVAGGIGLVILIAFGMFFLGNGEETEYQTVVIGRSTIRSSVSATGTLSALVTVEVGTQLSGQISELHADFNSEVAKGQLIARIDPATFENRVEQAEAELAIAEASVIQAQASVAESEATLAEAKRVLKRLEELRQRGTVSVAQLDTAMTEVEKAEARRTSAKAQVTTAKAQVKQRQASLSSAWVDLERTYIRSPVDGVVIGRDVDLGQTVAASLQAPILFTIARDLSKMQLEVNVDEADIGQIEEGLRVKFDVDAYSTRKFSGSVEQIRKAPLIEQNVVTYIIIVSADNADQKLLPGMTANVEIIVTERENVLTLPNRALRFRPPADVLASFELSRLRSASEGTTQARVWTMDNGKLSPAVITLGITDGRSTEIIEGLDEGQEIILTSAVAAQQEGRPRRRGPF